MRLWHKSLIKVLPKDQLIGAWRELSAIAGNINKKETPNHILVNKILDYPFNHFISYAFYIRQEMTFRGYKTMDSVWEKLLLLQRKITAFFQLMKFIIIGIMIGICNNAIIILKKSLIVVEFLKKILQKFLKYL